jgi:hypothetical protein
VCVGVGVGLGVAVGVGVGVEADASNSTAWPDDELDDVTNLAVPVSVAEATLAKPYAPAASTVNSSAMPMATLVPPIAAALLRFRGLRRPIKLGLDTCGIKHKYTMFKRRQKLLFNL